VGLKQNLVNRAGFDQTEPQWRNGFMTCAKSLEEVHSDHKARAFRNFIRSHLSSGEAYPSLKEGPGMNGSQENTAPEGLRVAVSSKIDFVETSSKQDARNRDLKKRGTRSSRRGGDEGYEKINGREGGKATKTTRELGTRSCGGPEASWTPKLTDQKETRLTITEVGQGRGKRSAEVNRTRKGRSRVHITAEDVFRDEGASMISKRKKNCSGGNRLHSLEEVRQDLPKQVQSQQGKG